MTRKVSSGEYLITTTPSLINCASCKKPILAVTIGGLDRHLGTETLNSTGELVALIARRSSYEMHGDLIFKRNVETIRSGGQAGSPVLADHSCDYVVPDDQIDHSFTTAAMTNVIRAMGGVIVGGAVSYTPPF